MVESDKVHCRKCGELKVRILDGKFPNSRDKRFRDESGNLWNGRTCPSCHKNKIHEGMKKLRFVRSQGEKQTT